MARFMSRKSVASVLARMFPQHRTWDAMVEIADRCNETCVHCYQVQGQKGELPTEDWKRIFDQLAEMGVLFLVISGGEATLRRDFLELVAYARLKRFAVKLYTNGLNMTQDVVDELARLAVQEVQISLYSHRAVAHDWVTGVPGSWERTVAGVRRLRERGIHVVVKTPLMQTNQHEFDDFVRFANELGADYSIDTKISPREDGSLDPTLMGADLNQVRALHQDQRFADGKGGSSPRDVALDHRPCSPCRQVHIEANGELRPCVALSVPIGDALRDDIRQAYEEGPDSVLLRTLTYRDIRGCRVCDLRSYCGRCYSDSLHQAGDALAPYVDACRRALLRYRMNHGPTEVVRASELVERSEELGPFRRREDGTLHLIEDSITERDEELRAKYPWLRTDATTPAHNDGGLVQLRRPGRASAIIEPMPVSRPCGNS